MISTPRQKGVFILKADPVEAEAFFFLSSRSLFSSLHIWQTDAATQIYS